MPGRSAGFLRHYSTVAFSDTVFVTLFRTAVETAVSNEVYNLLGTGGVPTSTTLLFWRWLTVSSVFASRSDGTSYASLSDFPLSPSLISLLVSVDVKHHGRRRTKRH